MARVIIVEDLKGKGESMRDYMLSKGHVCQLVLAADTKPAIDALENLMRAQHDVWNVLVLDIAFEHRDLFAGIKIYNSLIALGLRRRWHWTLLCTKLKLEEERASASSRVAPWKVVQIFCETAFIADDEHVVDARMTGRNEHMEELVSHLQSIGPPDRILELQPW